MANWDPGAVRRAFGLTLSDPQKAAIHAKLPASPEAGVYFADGVFEGGGVLGIAFGGARSFSEQEISVGQAFADLAALALENARLYQEAGRGRREAEGRDPSGAASGWPDHRAPDRRLTAARDAARLSPDVARLTVAPTRGATDRANRHGRSTARASARGRAAAVIRLRWRSPPASARCLACTRG